MKRINFLLLLLFGVMAVSCIPDKKQAGVDECIGCPEPISVVIPELLNDNQEVVSFVADGELMFNKWSKKGYALAKEFQEAEELDSSEMSFNESMKAVKLGLKMVGIMGEFASESLAMEERKEAIEAKLNEEENEAFREVIRQFEEKMEEMASELEAMGLETPKDAEDLSRMIPEE